MSSYSYKVTRETSGPRGGSYSTSSYSSPTAYSPVSAPKLSPTRAAVAFVARAGQEGLTPEVGRYCKLSVTIVPDSSVVDV